MAAFPSHRSQEPARRQALLSRVAAADEATRDLGAQLAAPGAGDPPSDPARLLVPAARALLGVLHRAGGGELVVSLGSDPARAVRVRDGAGGPSVELVRAVPAAPGAVPVPAAPVPTTAMSAADEGVAARLAALLRAGGMSR
jgi:hypothetical protein